MSETLKKLQRIYGEEKVKPDVFGRRDALPSEVEKVIYPDFKKLVDLYPPTEEDLWEKE